MNLVLCDRVQCGKRFIQKRSRAHHPVLAVRLLSRAAARCALQRAAFGSGGTLCLNNRTQIGAKKCSPLTHAARKAGRILLLTPFQPEFGKQGICLLPGIRPAHSVQDQRQRYIVDHLLVRKEQVLLQHIADRPRFSRDIASVQEDLPFLRKSKAGQNMKQGCFSGSAQAKKGDQFPFLQMDADILNDRPVIIFHCDVPRLKETHGRYPFENPFPVRSFCVNSCSDSHP